MTAEVNDRSTKRLVTLYGELAPQEDSRGRGDGLKVPLGPAVGAVEAVEDARASLKSLRVGTGGGENSFMSARMGGAYVRGT